MVDVLNFNCILNGVYQNFYLEFMLWLKIMNRQSEKLLISSGKMPAARRVRMSTSGRWQ